MSSSELWTVGRLLTWTTDYLKKHGSATPRLDAEVLLAQAMGCQRIGLYTAFDEVPAEATRNEFRELVRRRAEGMPVAYLVGHREFYSLSFRVTPDVLIPRPETETLVVEALDFAKQRLAVLSVDAELTIADVGTGSGIIAVCLAKHLNNCRVTALDISVPALQIAQENAKKHGVAQWIEFLESDIFSALPDDRQFDLIVSNPPYVMTSEMDDLPVDVRRFEPQQALLAGPRGTEVIERLILQAGDRLKPGGGLLFEISPTVHQAAVALLENDKRFEDITTIHDMARLPRVVRSVRRNS